MECVSLIDGGWVFDKNSNQSMYLNEYISIQDGSVLVLLSSRPVAVWG